MIVCLFLYKGSTIQFRTRDCRDYRIPEGITENDYKACPKAISFKGESNKSCFEIYQLGYGFLRSGEGFWIRKRIDNNNELVTPPIPTLWEENEQ